MKKYYGSYSHLVRREKELKEKAPLELTFSLFGKEEQEVTKEVYDKYSNWFYSK